MKFTKIHGAGNDFIIINNIEEKIDKSQFSNMAKRLCNRRLSIGADGLMIVDLPTGNNDYKMHFYNSDGSQGEMCGNGARCICRYGYEHNLACEIQYVETLAGLVTGYRLSKRQYKIELNTPTIIELEKVLVVDNQPYHCSYIELGNPGLPHLVIHYPNLETANPENMRGIAKRLRYHPDLPKGANVNFYDVKDDTHIIGLTYERGVEDFTLACGTGAGSTALALVLLGKVDNTGLSIKVPGGELFVEVILDDKEVQKLYLSGPTNIVAVGEIVDEEFFEVK
ncbi:MAG: diaminopimelate epimerase [Anaerovoracaceae bacterium]